MNIWYIYICFGSKIGAVLHTLFCGIMDHFDWIFAITLTAICYNYHVVYSHLCQQ